MQKKKNEVRNEILTLVSSKAGDVVIRNSRDLKDEQGGYDRRQRIHREAILCALAVLQTSLEGISRGRKKSEGTGN